MIPHPARSLFWSAIAFVGGVGAASWLVIPAWMLWVLASIPVVVLLFSHRWAVITAVLVALFVGGIARMPDDRVRQPPGERAIFAPIYRLRDGFLGSLNRAVPSPESSFFAGILVGARSTLPDAIKSDFKLAGVSHITAVSGYNITIVAEGVMGMLVYLMHRRRAFWVTLGVLFVFMILTGLQASVIRATIMGLAVLFARRLGRSNTPLHTLALTGAVMIAIDPTILRYDIGFQLSMLATYGILAVAPRIEQILPFLRRVTVLKLGETAAMTIAAQLCVLPLLVYYFRSISLVSLPANLAILPFIPFAMLVGFAAGLVGWIPLVGTVVGGIAWVLGTALLAVIHWFASLPWATISV